MFCHAFAYIFSFVDQIASFMLPKHLRKIHYDELDAWNLEVFPAHDADTARNIPLAFINLTTATIIGN
jgi:hypothetical protein